VERSRAFDYQPIYKKTTLSNGVRVVTEHHPFLRSVCAGIYVDLGTRDEPLGLGGAAHFIEHMVFKGTRKRSGFEVAKSLEEVGGELNAYTSREYTCFHATCLREHLDLAVDVLADIVTRATFKLEDFKTERQVILHEIDMSVDDHEEYIFDAYFERVYGGHPLGRPILGTSSTLGGMTRPELENYYLRHYHGRHLIVSVAGNVDHDRVVDMVEKLLGNEKRRAQPARRKKPPFRAFQGHLRRPTEQVHILMGGSIKRFVRNRAWPTRFIARWSHSRTVVY